MLVFFAFLSIIACEAKLTELNCESVPCSSNTISGSCGENVNWSLDDSGLLTLSGTGKMFDYESDNVPWKDSRDSIKTLQVDDGITYIGNYAFSDCTSLKEVKLADSVTSIGSYSFIRCSSLKSIPIGGLTSVGKYAFSECNALES